MKRFSEKLRMLQSIFGSNEIEINDILLKPYFIRELEWNKRKFPLLRHRVVAVTSPRVTTQNALHSKIHPFDRTVFAQGFNSILRTSWGETARGWGVYRNETLIKPNGKNE